MGKRDEKYKLMGEIEIDDAFFTRWHQVSPTNPLALRL